MSETPVIRAVVERTDSPNWPLFKVAFHIQAPNSGYHSCCGHLIVTRQEWYVLRSVLLHGGLPNRVEIIDDIMEAPHEQNGTTPAR